MDQLFPAWLHILTVCILFSHDPFLFSFRLMSHVKCAPQSEMYHLTTLAPLNTTWPANTTWCNLTRDGEIDDKAAYENFYLSAQFITGLICYPVVCLFGLTGNILSIIVLSQRKMRTSTNAYLVALAIADSIKLVNDFCYFLVIFLLNVDPPSGNKAYVYLYPYAHFIFNMAVCVTAWLTVSVTAERYIMVCHATRARGVCSILRARVLSAAVFGSMSLLAVPSALRYRTVNIWDNVTNTVTVDLSLTDLWQDRHFVKGYTWVQNLLRSVIPLIVLGVLNTMIIQALRKTRSTKKKLASRQRITLMLISVVVVFLVCVTPDAIMSTFFGFGYYEANYLVRGIREITDLLLSVNSAVNFVLYCSFNRVFRAHFLTLFCTRCSGSGRGRFSVMVEDSQMARYSVTVKPTTCANGNGNTAAGLLLSGDKLEENGNDVQTTSCV